MRTAELPRLLKIAERLARFVAQRDAHYKASWKRRGGPGAYFTMVRPIDRFEAIAERGVPSSHDPTYRNRNLPETTNSHDIFTIWEREDNSGELFKDGTLSACVQDIFAYMLLLMEEMDARKAAGNYQIDPQHEAMQRSAKLDPQHERREAMVSDTFPNAVRPSVTEQIPVDVSGNPIGRPFQAAPTDEYNEKYHQELVSKINGLQEALDNANLVISKQREQLSSRPLPTHLLAQVDTLKAENKRLKERLAELPGSRPEND